KHKSECPKIERKCSDCGANVLNEKIQNHQEEECQKRVVLCDACKSAMSYDELSEHKYECPKIERECFDCGVKVLNENLQDRLDKECQKRVVFCDACHSQVTYTQLG
ncbi:hypothetical protein ISCGN_020100, partial [Ixodes scapularis]